MHGLKLRLRLRSGYRIKFRYIECCLSCAFLPLAASSVIGRSSSESESLSSSGAPIGGLADREFKTGGMKLSFGSIMAIFAFLSTVVGGLYGGFVMYQKIEEVAGLDLGAYQQAMDVMDAKVTGIAEKVEESVEYSRDIKNGLRSDILSIEKQTDRIEDMVRKSEDKVRTMIDNAEVRFENQRERVRVSQSGDMKELEDKLMGKLQRALDNPLAD